MRAVFSDHGFHVRTHSSDFLLDILRKHGDVVPLYNEDWKTGLDRELDKATIASAIHAGRADLVVYFQQLPTPGQISDLGTRCVLVPMCDECDFTVEQWKNYAQAGVRILCFDQMIVERARAAGCQCLRTQYFPARVGKRDIPGLRVLYWQRRRTVNWAMVRTILSGNPVEQVIIKLDPDPSPYFERDPDPGHEKMLPGPDDIDRFNISFVYGWLERNEYLEILDQSTVFIAPRPKEGIGMASLEAMARGHCVISPDQGCTPQYISNGENGLLYDLDNPQSIDLSQYQAIGSRAHATVVQGAKQWQADHRRISRFLFEW